MILAVISATTVPDDNTLGPTLSKHESSQIRTTISPVIKSHNSLLTGATSHILLAARKQTHKPLCADGCL